MSKMTDKEIIKALENKKYGGHSCVNCKYGITKGEDRCGLKGCYIARNALDLINRQQAEIEKLNIELVGMRGACNSYKMHYDNAKAEIERLTNIIDDGAEVCHNCHLKYAEKIEQAKSEAIKEFAERLKEQAKANEWNGTICGLEIDRLEKEMVGDNK